MKCIKLEQKKSIGDGMGKRYSYEFVDTERDDLKPPETIYVFGDSNDDISMKLFKKYSNIKVIQYDNMIYHERKDWI